MAGTNVDTVVSAQGVETVGCTAGNIATGTYALTWH